MKSSGSVLPLEVILGQSLLHECNLRGYSRNGLLSCCFIETLKTITVVLQSFVSYVSCLLHFLLSGWACLARLYFGHIALYVLTHSNIGHGLYPTQHSSPRCRVVKASKHREMKKSWFLRESWCKVEGRCLNTAFNNSPMAFLRKMY